MLAVDGKVGFVTGLCVGRMWLGDTAARIPPWRDTGVEVRGPAVADIEHAFAQIWAMIGTDIPEDELPSRNSREPAGATPLRVIGTVPNTAGMFRLDQLVASLARERLWLTDAYYAGTTPYVQMLQSAARDGVDVRLLVPGATDIPVLRPLSRAGFRPLLMAGVRVFEWNGSMLHAKTAVADRRWSRVGSTNLNIASWLGNCELDVAIEGESFARQMEEMYLADLKNSTELVIDAGDRMRAPGAPKGWLPGSGGGSAGRATAGMLRIGNAVMSGRRVLGPVEAQLMFTAGVLLLAAGIVIASFPPILVYPAVAIAIWLATVFLIRGFRLYRDSRKQGSKSRWG
jgi:cardiolipin synthase